MKNPSTLGIQCPCLDMKDGVATTAGRAMGWCFGLACFCLRTETRARKTHVFGVGWVGWGGHVNVPCTSYIILCYAAKICGVVATLLVSTLLMGWGGVGGHVNVSCTSYIVVCYPAEISGIVATLLDEGEKPKNAPQIFPGFQIIKSARHCGKITIFGHNVHADEHGFRSGGMFL